jgi:hypothetical protein
MAPSLGIIRAFPGQPGIPFPADVAELVDALDLGSSIERCGSSSLPVRTKYPLKIHWMTITKKNLDRFSDRDFLLFQLARKFSAKVELQQSTWCQSGWLSPRGMKGINVL